MEGLSAIVCRGIKRYLRRKHYERLNGATRRRKGYRRRINLPRRLKLKLRFSPKKLLLRLRDAYVEMMMRLANSNGGYGFGVGPVKDYNERVIVEMYRSVLMKPHESSTSLRPSVYSCS